MTVRRKIAESRREISARSRKNQMRTRVVRCGSEVRARWPKARRSGGSVIVAEAFMSNAGYISTSCCVIRINSSVVVTP